MRRPVLVHALGGPAETIVDGVTGWHVPEPSVESFAAGIRRTLEDRPRWRSIGEQARQHALERYTTQQHARRYMAIVEGRLDRA